MEPIQPGITTATSYAGNDPYIGQLNDQVVKKFTVLTDAAATEPLARGTLMKPDLAGKLVPLAGGAVDETTRPVILWRSIPVADLVAGDVENVDVHTVGRFRRGLLVGYADAQEKGLNLWGIYTFA